MLNAKVYAAADFYRIPSLKGMAQTRFEKAVTKLGGDSETPKDIAQLAKVVEFIYENTFDEDQPGSSGLREIIVKLVVRYADKLLIRDKDGDSDLFDMMEQCGAFGRDFGLAMFKKWQGFRKVQCQQCRHIWADPRVSIPDVNCPGCRERKHSWNKYQVE